MSDPPPPPQVSPDGKFYWDGTRWFRLPPKPRDLAGWQVSMGWVPMVAIAPASPKLAWEVPVGRDAWVPRAEVAPPMFHKNFWILLGVLAVGGILYGIGVLTQPSKPPTCTVGYSNSNLNIEVTGQGANAACQELIKRGPGANPDGFPYGSGRTSQPSGSTICQVPLNGLTYVVRDTGIVTLYGDVACGTLKKQASSTPT